MNDVITCIIICPIGCKIMVKKDRDKVEIVGGNKCKRGEVYAKDEALFPKRMITTSVLVEGGEWPLGSVKTSQPVPKEKIFKVLEEVKKIRIKAPVKSGDIIIRNVADTGADIIATRTVKATLNLK